MRILSAALPFCLLFAVGFPPGEASGAEASENDYDHYVYFGVYTRDGKSKGIYVSRFDSNSGKITDPELAAPIENPSFLAFHPNRDYLYAVSEKGGGTATAFSIDHATGKLTELNTVTTRGGAPCDLEVDDTGKMLVVANYSGGSVAAYQIGEDGSLSEPSDFVQHEGSSVEERQKGPHAHSVDFSADNRFVMVADLGLDKVMIYRADPETGKLAPADPAFAETPKGSGPRHFAFHPSNQYAYSVNELASTVTAFTYDAGEGALEPIATVSTLPDEFEGRNTTAEIEAHPNGKFVYASNRGHHSIAVFAVDQETGELTRIQNASTQGETPRNFALDPSGQWLLAANQQTDNVFVYSVDQETGKLTPTGDSLSIGAPVCIKYLPID